MSAPDTFAVTNPRTGEADTRIVATDRDAMGAMAERARAAQTEWQARGMAERGEALMRLSNALEAHQATIAAALEHDTGRRRIAQQEVMGVVGAMRGWAQLAPTLLLESSWVQGRAKPNFKHRIDHVPYALVGVISPWNFPMTLSFIDTIPALMAGACVIVKPSEITPRFADVLKSVIKDVGLEDVLQFAQGSGITGAALVGVVDCICFTGSVETGRKVALGCAERLIPANLELGGKDPLIIAPGADLEAASSLALRSSVLATGQACQSIERVYVPAADHDDFLDRLIAKAKEVVPNMEAVDRGQIGPFIDPRQSAIVADQIADAIAKGAILHCGGDVMSSSGGHWMVPAVLSGVTHDMAIMIDETFGPVIPVMAYDTIEEAIALANDTAFGLSAGVFAKDLDSAAAIGSKLHAGAISLQDAALTGQYFEAEKQSFGQSGIGGSRMGAAGFSRFFRKRALIANTVAPLELSDFAEEA